MAKTGLLILALGLSMGLGGCVPWLGQTPQTIAQVEADHNGQSIRLTGRVTQQAPFLAGGAYAIADDTGEIWVFTHDALPEVNTTVTIRGEVRHEQLKLGSDRAPLTEQTIYIQEQDRTPP